MKHEIQYFSGDWAAPPFPRQYVLSKTPERIPAEWQTVRIGDWWLGSLGLPVMDVEDADGSRIGVCLGHPVNLEGTWDQGLVMPARNGEASHETVEELYRRLSGRFVLLLIERNRERLFLDPYGSLATVFAEDEPTVASTPHLLGSREWDHELIRTLRMPESGLWFPSGLTAKQGVRRLLPNHFLDLRNWTVKRHWPQSPSDLTVEADWRDGVDVIVDCLKRSFEVISTRFPVQVPLTAGRDSRMLLACARKFLSRTTFATFSERSLTMDMQIAGELARRFGLSHEFLTSA